MEEVKTKSELKICTPGSIKFDENEYQYYVLNSLFSPPAGSSTNFLNKILSKLDINILLRYAKHISYHIYSYIIDNLVKNRFNELLKYFTGNTTQVYKNLIKILDINFLTLLENDLDIKTREKYRKMYDNIYYIIGKKFLSSQAIKYVDKEGTILYNILLDETGMSQKKLRKTITDLKNASLIPERLITQNRYNDIDLGMCSYKFLINNYDALNKHYKNFENKFEEIFSINPLWKGFEEYEIMVLMDNNEMSKIMNVIVKNFENNGIKVNFIFSKKELLKLTKSKSKKILFLTNKKSKNLNKFFSIFVGDHLFSKPVNKINDTCPVLQSLIYWEINNNKITYLTEAMDLNFIFLTGFSMTVLNNIMKNGINF